MSSLPHRYHLIVLEDLAREDKESVAARVRDRSALAARLERENVPLRVSAIETQLKAWECEHPDMALTGTEWEAAKTKGIKAPSTLESLEHLTSDERKERLKGLTPAQLLSIANNETLPPTPDPYLASIGHLSPSQRLAIANDAAEEKRRGDTK